MQVQTPPASYAWPRNKCYSAHQSGTADIVTAFLGNEFPTDLPAILTCHLLNMKIYETKKHRKFLLFQPDFQIEESVDAVFLCLQVMWRLFEIQDPTGWLQRDWCRFEPKEPLSK